MIEWPGFPVDELPSIQTDHATAWAYLTGLSKDKWDRRCVFTYAITDGEYVKVGRTDHLTRRINQIQSGNPRTLTWLGWYEFDIESQVHSELKSKGLHRFREWFVDCYETRRILDEWNLYHEPRHQSPDHGVEEHW